MTAFREAQWSDPVRAFLTLFNERMCRDVDCDSVWVRMRPPTRDELEDVQEDVRTVPFLRVGSLGTVIDVCPRYVTVRCGSDALVYERREFLSTWTRAIGQDKWKVQWDSRIPFKELKL